MRAGEAAGVGDEGARVLGMGGPFCSWRGCVAAAASRCRRGSRETVRLAWTMSSCGTKPAPRKRVAVCGGGEGCVCVCVGGVGGGGGRGVWAGGRGVSVRGAGRGQTEGGGGEGGNTWGSSGDADAPVCDGTRSKPPLTPLMVKVPVTWPYGARSSIAFMNVVFPPPEGPISATREPSGNDPLMSLSTVAFDAFRTIETLRNSTRTGDVATRPCPSLRSPSVRAVRITCRGEEGAGAPPSVSRKEGGREGGGREGDARAG